jgi:hypothetical protein
MRYKHMTNETSDYKNPMLNELQKKSANASTPESKARVDAEFVKVMSMPISKSRR